MTSLKSFENIGLRITWKLINIGFLGSEVFKGELEANAIIDFAMKHMDDEQNSDIAELACEFSADVYGINQHIEKLSHRENSDYDTEFRKWRVLYVISNLPNEDEDYVKGLIAIGDIWSKFNFPNDSPHVFQGRRNEIAPDQYYTKENFIKLLRKQINWTKIEIDFLKQQQNQYNDGYEIL